MSSRVLALRWRRPALLAVVLGSLAVALAADRAGTLDGSLVGRGGAPYALAVEPGGRRVAVALFDASAIGIADAEHGAMLGHARIPRLEREYEMRPIQVLWSRARGRPLVICHRSGRILEVDPDGAPTVSETLVPSLDDDRTDAERTADRMSALAIDESEDGVLRVVLGAVRTQILSFRVLTYRWQGGWQRQGQSRSVALTPPGYHRGAWPVAWLASEGVFFVGEPGTGRIRVFDRDLALVREVTIGSHPAALALDPARGLLYVADKRSGLVEKLDALTLESLGRIEIGASAVSLALEADGRHAWVADSFGDALVRLALPKLEVQSRLAWPRRPFALALGPGPDELLVARLGSGRVDRCDGRSGESLRRTAQVEVAP